MNATGIPPPSTTTTATSSSSPLAPVPPPTKKQRSTGETGYPDMDVATDAIAKRRAELRRLQRAQARPVGAAAAAAGGGKPPTGSTDDLLARAKAETKGGAALPPHSGGPSLAAAAANPFGAAATSGFRGAGNLKPSKIPAPSPRNAGGVGGGEGPSADPPGASPTQPPSPRRPGEQNVSGIRQSALYRTFAAERGGGSAARDLVFPAAGESEAGAAPPSGAPAAAAIDGGGGGPPKATDAGGVARRLDRTFRSTGASAAGGGRAGVPTGGRVAEAPTFEERRTRSKSAPPRRPPPPAGGPPPQRSASRGKPRIPAAPRSGPPGAAPAPVLSPEPPSGAVGSGGVKAASSPERSATRRSERPRDTGGKLRERHGDVAPATPMPGSAVRTPKEKKTGAKSSTRRKDALMALRDKALTPVKMQKATPAPSADAEGKDAATVATEGSVTDGSAEEKKDGSHAPVESPQKPVKAAQPLEEEAAAGKKQREESNALRMMKELNAANDKAAKALMQVAKLEEEVENLRRQNKDFGGDHGEMNGSSTPRRQGEPRSFFEVAREAGVATPAGLMSPYPHNGAPSPGLDGSPLRRRAMSSGGISLGEADHVPMRKRTMTPQPRRKHRTSANRQDASTPAAEQIDVERQFFKAASLAVPEEYTSSLATYFVRRPYLDGKDDDASDADVQRRWDTHGSLPSSEYSGTADVSDPETIEVMATIVADESFLILSGPSKVRHGRTMGTTLSARDDLIEWRTFEDADCPEKPLGCVMYIDEYCNEREYWLDSIYEEALATREAYCSSLYSAASALQTTSANTNENRVDMSAAAPPAPVPVMPTNGTGGMDHTKVEEPQPDSKQIGTETDGGFAVTRRKPAMADACVGTDPIVLPPRNDKPEMKQDQPKMPPSVNVKSKAPAQGKSTPPDQKEEEEEAHINDILSSLIGRVLSIFFGAFWFMFILLPFRILSWTLCIGMISIMLSVCWLYLADDHGAARIGAGIDYDYNRPGIF